MGTIRKQSIIGTIVIYFGVIIGFINTGILLPKLFSTSEIGLINVLVAYATIFAQFASLGFNNATTRLFPYFREKESKHNGFLGLGFGVITVGYIVCLIVFFGLHHIFIENGAEKSPLFRENINLIVPLYAFILLFVFLDNYLKVLYRSTIGLFLKEVVQRVIILVCILLFALNVIDFTAFLYLYIIAYVIPVTVAIVSLVRSGDFSLRINLGFLSNELKKELISVSVYGILAGFMGVITINIDRLMVQNFLGLSATGIYSTAFFFGTVVALPTRSVVKISTAYLAESWKNNDLETIKSIYTRSSITQLIFGLLVYGGLLINLDNIFRILGEQYITGKYVIVFIGLAYLCDMAIGVGAYILVTSKYFKYQTWLLLIFLVLVIGTNAIFIPKWGIAGAAFASLLSKFIHNLLKLLVVKVKLQLQPFSSKSLWAVIFAVMATAIGIFIPESESLIFNIGIRSVVFVVVLMGFVYFFKLSDDINDRIDAYASLVFGKLSK